MEPDTLMVYWDSLVYWFVGMERNGDMPCSASYEEFQEQIREGWGYTGTPLGWKPTPGVRVEVIEVLGDDGKPPRNLFKEIAEAGWDYYRLICGCWARDKEHAKEITEEIRVQLLAEGNWQAGYTWTS